MELAAMFADIGLLAVPGGLLGVQGPLTPQTLELVRAHPETSAEILEPLSRVGVPVAAVRAHHERLDGSGYPKGLRGRQVPFGAQALAVVDCYAAMVRPRPHRPELAPEAALAALREEAAAGRLASRLVDLMHEVIAGRAHPVPSGNGNRDSRHAVTGTSRSRLGLAAGVQPAPDGARSLRYDPGQPLG